MYAILGLGLGPARKSLANGTLPFSGYSCIHVLSESLEILVSYLQGTVLPIFFLKMRLKILKSSLKKKKNYFAISNTT